MTSFLIVLLYKIYLTLWFSGYADFSIFLSHLYLIYEVTKFDICQIFYQASSNHLVNWDIGEFDSSSSHHIVDIIMLNINIFCFGIEDEVISQCNWSLVITFQSNYNFYFLGYLCLLDSPNQLIYIFLPLLITYVLVDGLDVDIIL